MLDQETFTQLVKAHKGSVFRLAYGYLRSQADADDVAQTVFLKLYHRAEGFEDDDHLRRWLMRVTLNECASLYRALRRRPEPIDDYVETLALPTPRHADLFRRLMALPTRYRMVLQLYYCEGYTAAEVGGLLGIPRSTVYTRLARGRQRLRDILEEEGEDRW